MTMIIEEKTDVLIIERNDESHMGAAAAPLRAAVAVAVAAELGDPLHQLLQLEREAQPQYDTERGNDIAR